MAFKTKIWHQPPFREKLEKEIAFHLEVPSPVARVLVNRGIDTPEEARRFLSPSLEHLHDPWKLKGIKSAVSRIGKALEKGEKITVYGDYDVDGIASAALLTSALRLSGAEVDYYLPNRFQEGYGLQKEPLEEFKDKGCSLLITTDCGTNSSGETAYARQLGIDTIITDHHYPLEISRDHVALINPHQQDCSYPWNSLSGTGVAFKLICALQQVIGDSFDPYQYLDLVALGTVADLVPLLGENRVLTCFGLDQINNNTRPGLRALMKASGIDKRQVGVYELAFILSPALNAAGRLGSAAPAAELLLGEIEEQALEIAEFLRGENQSRRDTEQKILEEARAMVEQDPQGAGSRVIVLAGENWHQGVIGIVASRLLDLYYRPVALIALDGESGKGSARSIPGFNITAALKECETILDRFGGHEQAAGFSLPAENIPLLREKLNQLGSEWLSEEDLVPRLRLEGELGASEINLELARYLDKMAPHGAGNPVPLFSSRGWFLDDCRLVGKDKKHLKFRVSRENNQLEPIIFSGKEYLSRLNPGRQLDLAFTVKNGKWEERPVLNLEVKDFYFADGETNGSVEIIDRRGAEDRLSYLNRAVFHSSCPLIYTGTGRRKQYIIEKYPGTGKRAVMFYSNHLDTGVMEGDVCDLFLFHLPLQLEIVQKIVENCNNLSFLRVHLLYNRSDREVNHKILEAALPSKGTIGGFCEVLREHFPGERIFDKRDLEDLRQKRIFQGSSSLLQRCWQVLEETGIIMAGKEGWFINPCFSIPGENELADSKTYREAIELQESCAGFQDFMLDSSDQDILQCISSFCDL